jgi:hypothetical protein
MEPSTGCATVQSKAASGCWQHIAALPARSTRPSLWPPGAAEVAAGELWKRRLAGWGRAWTQRVHLQSKDLAWLLNRRTFAKQVPRLLREHQWIFLVGCNNSGTTLIHDFLAATGKFSFMPHEGQRYTNVFRRARKRGHQRVWTEYVEELRMDEQYTTREVPRLLFDWFQELDRPVKARILEKTTANAVRMRWLQRVFPGARFIGIVRNGYAVVEGIKRKGNKAVDRGARHWKRVNEIMLEDATQVRNFLLVRYEDFVSSPQETLPRIAQFLDLTSEELEAAFAHTGRRPAGGSGTSMIQNMNALSLQRLDEEERRIVTREAGELLNELGYAALRDSA